MSFWFYTINWTEKKTVKHTCLEQLEFSMICTSLDIFKSQTLAFFPLCFFCFSLQLLVNSSFERFFNVFTFSKQNYGENILQNSESLVTTVVKFSCGLGIHELSRKLLVSVFPFFFFVNSSCSTYLDSFSCLIRNNLTNIFKPRAICHFRKYHDNLFPKNRFCITIVFSSSWDDSKS